MNKVELGLICPVSGYCDWAEYNVIFLGPEKLVRQHHKIMLRVTTRHPSDMTENCLKLAFNSTYTCTRIEIKVKGHSYIPSFRA